VDEITTCGNCAHQHAPGEHAGADTPLLGAMDRRELLRRGGLAAALLLLASCGAATDSLTGPSGVTIKLSDFPALASNGGVAMVSSQVAVENNGGTYIALSRVCPHQGGQIQQVSFGFQCPIHGASFDKTGRWIGGQPTSSMQRLTVTANADGTLTIKG
jgi:cytochrome b6-f complex iron-sulfur subunit